MNVNTNKNVDDYIKYIKSIKNDKYYKLHKYIFYITPNKGPHLDFYNNPIGFDGGGLEKKVTKLRSKFIKGIMYLINCDKNEVSVNPNVVKNIIQQLEKCTSNREYWIRYGFNYDQADRITAIYQMLIEFYNDYYLMKRKKTPVVGIGRSGNGNRLYKFLIKMNNSIDVDPVQLQLFAIQNLNKHINKFVNYINGNSQQLINNKEHIHHAIATIMDTERAKYTPFESEKELLIESKKLLMDLHTKTKNIVSGDIKIPNIAKITVKSEPSIDSKWSSKSNSDKNTIYIDTTKYKNYSKEELYGVLAHEGLPGHLLEKTNKKIVIESLDIDDELHPMGFRGIKMLHEGWAIYSTKLVNPDIKFTLMNSILYDIRAIIDIGLNCSEGIVLTLDDAKLLLKNYTRLSDERINDEIQRYLVNPGDATTYIIGELMFDEIHKFGGDNKLDVKVLNTALIIHISTANKLFEYIKKIKL